MHSWRLAALLVLLGTGSARSFGKQPPLKAPARSTSERSEFGADILNFGQHRQGRQRVAVPSVDDTTIVSAGLACLFAVVALWICSLVFGTSLNLKGKAVRFIYVIGAASMLASLGCYCQALHHVGFVADSNVAATLHRGSSVLSRLLLTTVLFLVAKGWAFASDRGWHQTAVLAALAFVWFITVACEVAKGSVHNSDKGMFPHETTAGCALLVLDLFVLAEALLSMWELSHEDVAREVKTFYRLASVACGTFFISLPALSLCSLVAYSDESRLHVVEVEMGSQFVATLLLTMCFKYADAYVAMELSTQRVKLALHPQVPKTTSADPTLIQVLTAGGGSL